MQVSKLIIKLNLLLELTTKIQMFLCIRQKGGWVDGHKNFAINKKIKRL